MNNTLDMIVLGPSRVGKTSLLATMSKEFAKLETSFGFHPTGDTAEILDDAYQKLADVKAHERFTVVEDLLGGTKTFVEYPFDVTLDGRRKFGIRFHDYRGNALSRESDPDFGPLLDRLSRCRVIFNVVDAAALKELDAIRSDRLNAHTRLATVLTKALKPDERRLVVFVLVKSESYVKTEKGRHELIARFEELHKPVLNAIEAMNRGGHNIVGVTIPVNTLGCVEFKELDGDNFVFERTHREFAPKDVDQPLRFALAFALKELNGDRWWLDKVWSALLGKDAVFHQALADFGRKRLPGLRVYGNKTLLRISP